MKYNFASSKKDFHEILKLQNSNFKEGLSEEELANEGFVTVRHDEELLTKFKAELPQIVATEDNEIIAYALAMSRKLENTVPILQDMFSKFEQLSYQNRSLNSFNYYVMGQICIQKEFRARGIFRGLYRQHKKTFYPDFDLCLTEVSKRNIRSLRAHLKVGFIELYSYQDKFDDWKILLLDFARMRDS